MKPGLTALLHSRSNLIEFFKSYESNEPFVVHGLGKTIQPLTSLPFLKSLDELLKSWPNSIQAHLPDVADEASSIDTSPRDARKLFNNGMGLLFDHAHTISPVLNQWLEAIRKDLGLSALTYGRCLMYATPQGKGTAPHFDQNVNFVLQIRGTKKWWIAPNRHVENPLTRHTMGLPADAELQSYSKPPFPTRMPSGISPILLKPGSLLFVPRGSWHSTKVEKSTEKSKENWAESQKRDRTENDLENNQEGSDAALSLNFTYTAPTWLDLLTTALRSRLALSSEWRETADGVSALNRADRELAEQKFDLLLAELVQDLPNWRASEILGATEP